MNAPTNINQTNKDDITQLLSRYDIPSIKRYQKRSRSPSDKHLPGDNGMPVIGHLYPFLTNLHDWLNHQYQTYGPIFKFRTPIIKGVYLIGPEANKLVFQNEGQLFSNFLAWEPTFNNLFDNNLLQRDFRDHKTHRKILQQAFKRQAIEGHI